jgi:hypothetical protein
VEHGDFLPCHDALVYHRLRLLHASQQVLGLDRERDYWPFAVLRDSGANTPTSNSTTARPAATPDITGSLVRKPTSAAKWRRNGDTAIKVAAAATTTIRRAETTSTEPRGAAADFAASRPDLPTELKPATTNNSYTEHESKGAEEEMPLIWPVLTEAQPAELPDSSSDSVLPAFLAGALVMVLLCVGAIFKTRSSLGAGRAHLLSFFQSIKFGRFS